ncbi:hypothetical protein GY45DRAFT_1270510 [Cubamyces sp. BRFM 1775]|nr:hypothetical protein GY45DRAFT_1270510 [Cubamyces sp. BRFM 1775]
MLRSSFPRIEAELMFNEAFPDSINRTKAVTQAMIQSAATLGHAALEERLRKDNLFTRLLTAIPSQRISTFRGAVKKVADAHVTAFYQLAPEECSAKIPWLFNHLTYIYPGDFSKQSVPWGKPYQHPAVAAVIRACFFTGIGAFATLHADRFASSLPDRADEREIPMAMLALVSTAIHASLAEWKTGSHKSIPFSGDAFLDVYNEHRTLLIGIHKQNIRAYHTMMHRLYAVSSGTLQTQPAGAGAAANALAQVDIAAMDVD